MHDLYKTRTNHASIWKAVRAFDRVPVLYAFRFDNGKTKFGLTTNIVSRADAHLAHGITGCTGVTVVTCDKHLLREAEARLLELLAEHFEQQATEVFASSDGEETDGLFIEAVIKQVTAERAGERHACDEDGDQCVHDRLDAVECMRNLMKFGSTKALRAAINESEHHRAQEFMARNPELIAK
jgi:hypothetical protein